MSLLSLAKPFRLLATIAVATSLTAAATADTYQFNLTETTGAANNPVTISGIFTWTGAATGFELLDISNTANPMGSYQLLDNGGNVVFSAPSYGLLGTPTGPSITMNQGVQGGGGDVNYLHMQTVGLVSMPARGSSVTLDSSTTVLDTQDSSGVISGTVSYYSGTITNINAVPSPTAAWALIVPVVGLLAKSRRQS